MNIFPIGTLSESSSNGSINTVAYSMFEPNAGCRSYEQGNTLTTLFEKQTILTRKKSLRTLIMEYTYADIFAREYQQLEHFLYSIADGKLNTFYVVDFAKGVKPTITESSGDWVCAIPNTRLYTTTLNEKSNYGFVWTGSAFKIGLVTALSDNTSITLDVDTNNYGSLALAIAQQSGILYPVYEVYSIIDSLSDFTTGSFFDDLALGGTDSGYLRSGSISFISKYKV